MNPKNKLFIFDMDGVIVDTMGALYSIYIEFLNEFEINGTKDEFEILNGPKIEEIVEYLKMKYNFQLSKEELLERYNKRIESIYSKVTLIKGIEESLVL